MMNKITPGIIIKYGVKFIEFINVDNNPNNKDWNLFTKVIKSSLNLLIMGIKNDFSFKISLIVI